MSALRWLPWAQDRNCLPSNYRGSVPFLFPFFLSLLCASFSPAERAAISPTKGGYFERRCSGLQSAQSPVLILLLLGGRSGLQGFCYSLYFLGAVDVLYAPDVLCEMRGLAWVGCRYFVLHWFSLWSILECWETGNFVGRMMERGDGVCGMC